MSDIRESELPDIGYTMLEDIESGEQLLINTSDEHFREEFTKNSIEHSEKVKNDITKLLGPPSTKSTFDNDLWVYIERKTTNSTRLLKFGQRELIVNNVLILEIDTKGLLVKKDFYNKENMEKIKFSKDITTISYNKRSFVYDFLSSMRQKINDPLGVRAKKRKKITQQ